MFYQLTVIAQDDYRRDMKLFQLNLVFAWLWIFLGFASGLYLGLHFHKENWLGGYSSFKRRMYRLGHISFFGLGAVIFIFYLTAQQWMPGGITTLASWCFIIGGITMPLCCMLMAHRAQLRMLFAVPVLSLILAGVCTLIELLHV
jgi:hypothetical protein